MVLVLAPILVPDPLKQTPPQAPALNGGVDGEADDPGPAQGGGDRQTGMGAQGLGEQMTLGPATALVDLLGQVLVQSTLAGNQGGGDDVTALA